MIVWKIWTLKPLIVKPGQEPLEFNILGDGSLVKRVMSVREFDRSWSNASKYIQWIFCPNLGILQGITWRLTILAKKSLWYSSITKRAKAKRLKKDIPFFLGTLGDLFIAVKLIPVFPKTQKYIFLISSLPPNFYISSMSQKSHPYIVPKKVVVIQNLEWKKWKIYALSFLVVHNMHNQNFYQILRKKKFKNYQSFMS